MRDLTNHLTPSYNLQQIIIIIIIIIIISIHVVYMQTLMACMGIGYWNFLSAINNLLILSLSLSGAHVFIMSHFT